MEDIKSELVLPLPSRIVTALEAVVGGNWRDGGGGGGVGEEGEGWGRRGKGWRRGGGGGRGEMEGGGLVFVCWLLNFPETC